MAVKTYDPKKVSVIAGVQPLSGFAPDEFITAEQNEDDWTILVGADGEATRSKNANKSGRITINLMQTSASNDYLSGLQIADQLTGKATFPGLIKDHFGTTLCSWATGWIVKKPPAAFAKEPGTRQWVIETDDLVQFVGGN